MLREKAALTLAGIHAGPLSWLNWNLEMLVLWKGGKPEKRNVCRIWFAKSYVQNFDKPQVILMPRKQSKCTVIIGNCCTVHSLVWLRIN